MAKPRVLPVPLPNQAAAVLWRGDEGDPALRAQEGEGGERRLARGAGEAIPSRRRGGETEARAHTGRASAAGAEHRRREENPTVYTSLKVTAEKGTTVFGSHMAMTAARACRLTWPGLSAMPKLLE